jgi:ribA/ribD-fused uncharacterized protein
MNSNTVFWIVVVVVILVLAIVLIMSSSRADAFPVVEGRWARCTNEMRDTRTDVKGFCGRHAFLSNFYEHPIVRNGIRYGSSEAAYQAAKYDDRPAIQQLFINVTPDESKKLVAANSYDARAFSRRRVDVMRQVLEAKFADPMLRRLLLATGKKQLEEYNWWGDTYWGVTRNGGANQLGIMLMELRERLR